MAAMMLCTCSGDQSKFEEMPRSPESLATRDFSASASCSRTGNRETTPDDSQVNEVESDLRETLSLNYEVWPNLSLFKEEISCFFLICSLLDLSDYITGGPSIAR
jgi:hypothetical protein